MSLIIPRDEIATTSDGKPRNIAKKLVSIPCWPQAVAMLERGLSYRDVARYIHEQGYITDLGIGSLARALGRYADIYMEDRKQHPIPPALIESVWEGTIEAVNEIGTLNRLITTQLERVEDLVADERVDGKYNKAVGVETGKAADMILKLGRLKKLIGVGPNEEFTDGEDDEEAEDANSAIRQLIRDGTALSEMGEIVEVVGGTREAKAAIRQGLVQSTGHRRPHGAGD